MQKEAGGYDSNARPKSCFQLLQLAISYPFRRCSCHWHHWHPLIVVIVICCCCRCRSLALLDPLPPVCRRVTADVCDMSQTILVIVSGCSWVQPVAELPGRLRCFPPPPSAAEETRLCLSIYYLVASKIMAPGPRDDQCRVKLQSSLNVFRPSEGFGACVRCVRCHSAPG
ncbi:hypothetical protein LZ31DRAFT_7066 [Colletotrichum somersetense]|nr:hypothetical protein LZ31DRAFT_7066 [Colletotrichum somersetense]